MASLLSLGLLSVGTAAWFGMPHVERKIVTQRLRKLCRAHRWLCLTFDDGPSAGFTPRLLDRLRQHGIKASFFILGKHAHEEPGVVQAILSGGHDLGGHSFQHLHAWKTLPGAHCRDIVAGQNVVRAFGGDPTLCRAPYGRRSLASWLQMERLGLRSAWWTIDPKDSTGLPHDVDVVLRRARDAGGGIVLLHDRRLNVAAQERYAPEDHENYVLTLVDRFARLAATDGYRFVRISEILGAS